MDQITMFTIKQIQRNFSESAFEKEIQEVMDSDDEWLIEYFTPQDNNYITAQIVCFNSNITSKMESLYIEKLPVKHRNWQVMKSIEKPIERSSDAMQLCDLPYETIFKIIDSCDLKDQINAAKTCKYLYNSVCGTWQRRHRTFNYNYIHFKIAYDYSDEDIEDVCIMSGKYMKKIRFSTHFTEEMLDALQWQNINNPMEYMLDFVNTNFINNLPHFENLVEFEVQGKFLQDRVIEQLSVFCKNLRVFRTLDMDNRWLTGHHMHKLTNLEYLDLKSCRYLDLEQFMLCSKCPKLQHLALVECDTMKNTPKMLEFCFNWSHLVTLRITAINDDPYALRAILNMPMLKTLQIYWTNFIPMNIEQNFFPVFYYNTEKCQKLIELTFENDRFLTENESFNTWTEHTYAVMREKACIAGNVERLSWSNDVFNKFARLLENVDKLHKISFIYNRILSYDQLFRLPNFNSNLKCIFIKGCQQEDDANFAKDWEKIHKNCQIKFSNLLTYHDIQRLKNYLLLEKFGYYYNREPVLLSIECKFD